MSNTLATYGRPTGYPNGKQEHLDAAELTRVFCPELHLPECVSGLAGSMADFLASWTDGQGHSPLCIAPVCIYMAACGIRRPKGISEISWVAGTSDEDTGSLYQRMYSVRGALIDLEDLERHGSGSTVTVVRIFDRMVWPSLEDAESGVLRGIWLVTGNCIHSRWNIMFLTLIHR